MIDRYMFYKTQHDMNIMTCPNNSYNRVGLVECRIRKYYVMLVNVLGVNRWNNIKFIVGI